MSTTRGLIRREAARLCGLLAAEGTATGGSQSTLVDTGNALKGTDLSSYLFEGCWLLMTSGTEAGNWREIAKAPLSGTTGTLTVANPFVTGPSSGDAYEIYAGLTPNVWSLRDNNAIVDNALRECRYLCRSPITLVTDGDMETSGTSNWTSSNATIAKSTTDVVTDGTQSLVVTNTAANGYAQSASVAVRPSAGMRVFVDYRCTTTTKSTATLIAWDVTNGASIYSSTGVDSGVSMAPSGIAFSFAVPATCYQVAFRLQGSESTAVIAWDDLIVMDDSAQRYTAPSWITDRTQSIEWLLRSGSRPRAYKWNPAGWALDLEEYPTAVTTFIVNLPPGIVQSPVYAFGEQSYGPMSATADSTTTAISLEWAMYATAAYAYWYYSKAVEQNSQGRIKMDQTRIERKLADIKRQHMPWQGMEHRIGFKYPWSGMTYSRMP